MPNLFHLEEFTSSAGLTLPFKIECDALTNADWQCLASMLFELCKKHDMFANYANFVGIPQGGLKLANYLNKLSYRNGADVIVDDVLTTGKSMVELIKYRKAQYGIVVFSRGDITLVNRQLCTCNNALCTGCPQIFELFQLHASLCIS